LRRSDGLVAATRGSPSSIAAATTIAETLVAGWEPTGKPRVDEAEE